MTALIANPLIAPVWPAELSYASPNIRTLAEPSSDSGRSRRSSGSLSDDSPVPAPDGFVESALRAGGPSPLRRLSRLQAICRREGFPYKEMNFCGRRSVYEPDAVPIVTLLVLAERAGVPGSWIGLARKLYGHLRALGIPDISVEIMDRGLQQRPKIHPFLPTNAIFPIWTKVATEIFQCIDRTGVFTIGCFRIGSTYDRSKCPPTILLGVDRKAKREWKTLRETVVRILDKNNLDSVAVTIRKDNQITRRGDEMSEDAGARMKDCRSDPRLGTSLSPRSLQHGYGTLGGWVEIFNHEMKEWVPFALTCSHCCFPDESGLSKGDVELLRNWKKHGVRPQHANKDRLLPIDSPSYRDMKRGIEKIRDDIKELKSDRKCCEIDDLMARGEFVVPYNEKMWKSWSQDIKVQEAEQQKLKQFFDSKGYYLGYVFAASGLREVQSTVDPKELSIRDWALVRLVAPRCPGKNAVELSFSGHNRTLTQLREFETEIPQWDDELYKTGRSTKTTSGRYGKLLTCSIARRTVNGKTVDVPTWEHVITHPGHTVVREGNSGSLLYYKNGSVLGMIFGGNGTHDLGYFTSTSDLLADIKHITGAKELRLRYVE